MHFSEEPPDAIKIITLEQVDELLNYPKLSLEERRYELRRDYETWFSDLNKQPDAEAWVVEGLINRQKDYFKALATFQDEKKEMPTTQNLYQRKDLMEWWNYKLCDEFDKVANTWLLDLDVYIHELAIKNELRNGP